MSRLRQKQTTSAFIVTLLRRNMNKTKNITEVDSEKKTDKVNIDRLIYFFNKNLMSI